MSKARPANGCDGVILLDKPVGLSSNGVLQRVRRLFDGVKAGHTGTLDPQASGLLPICLGEATKFAQGLIDSRKRYEAVIRLGWRSSTGDAEGTLTAVSEAHASDEAVSACLERFTGELEQTPPMYSAVKVDGQPLYRLARRGITLDRAPRQIFIHELTLLSREADRLTIGVICSKGTYIRTLAEDIGDCLGCGGYLEKLRRTDVGEFALDGAVTLERLEQLDSPQRRKLIEPMDALLAGLPALVLTPMSARRVGQGQAVCPEQSVPAPGIVRIYVTGGAFLGVGEVGEDGMVRPRRLLTKVAEPEVNP